MFVRQLEPTLLAAAKQFPAVVLTGPRQSGKTSTVQKLFGKTHDYVLFEDPDTRARIAADPRGFLNRLRRPAIFDEFQQVPEIASYLQGAIDADRKHYGRFILTGSQNFQLMEQVSQSLAGRTAVLSLLPLSLTEQKLQISAATEVDRWLLRGGYPETASRHDLNHALWLSSYLQTYLERDVRRITNVTDLVLFERFLRLIAARSASLLNISEVARDCGASVSSIQRWISILEAGYQILRVEPWFVNISKRIVKSPKLYITDAGLMSGLCGIQSTDVISIHPLRGNIFETAVMMEIQKSLLLLPFVPRLHFFRTAQGLEADILVESAGHLILGEIKSGQTFQPDWGAPLLEIEKLLKRKARKFIFAPVDRPMSLKGGIDVLPIFQIRPELFQ
ncbi:MAG: ATP-binding protein [Planctomycetes bacterium]|nr:ATP-binding protein [Planctomycetota bacterium]